MALPANLQQLLAQQRKQNLNQSTDEEKRKWRRREYARQWRARNPDKVRANQEKQKRKKQQLLAPASIAQYRAALRWNRLSTADNDARRWQRMAEAQSKQYRMAFGR